MGRHRLSLDKKWLKELHLSAKTQVKNLQNSQAYHWLDYRNYRGLARTLRATGLLAMAGLILFSAISPLVDIYVTHKYYSLNSTTSGLVGNVSDTLAKQITYDNAKNAYVFNSAGMTPTTQTVGPDKVPLSLLQAKVSGNKSAKTLYSVVMPTDPKQGISYYDSNTGLSFQLVPDFTQMSAEQISNHIVYPINKDMQIVYSVKNNGLKEDIILKQHVGDSFSYSYSLKLPKTLEARMLTDGSGDLGIYSADPSLFTHSTYGADYDPAKIESAQLHAKKDHLLFAIPAPVIKQTGVAGQGSANAYFKLSQDGQTLTVNANNLRGLHYPITVDPTVVITSTSDFSIGNNEDNNITYPANQISRGSLTGGSISGGWAATTVLPSATYVATSVVYNGYIYEIGGDNPGLTSTVLYAPINANGTIGAWTATTSLPSSTDSATSVAYNGYLYEIGGCNPGCATTAVLYAPINANGSLGAWTVTTSLPSGVRFSTSVAYNGYLYEIGGYIAGATAIVDYAPINANGTIGAWTATTSLPAATYDASSAVYNGYVYILGGYTAGGLTTVDYAPINANGTIGAWAATTALPAATYNATSVVYNGYIYEIGGWNGTTYSNTVSYAPINANGTIGAWTATASLPATTDWANSIAYNGFIYEIGGYNGTAIINTVSYAKIDSAGITTSYTATTVLPAATAYASSVAYNGYVYEIGGNTGSNTTTVDYAPLNANGTVGTWTATTVLPVAIDWAASVAYNGYLYEIGGYNGTANVATVYYAPINTNGTIGAWATTTALPLGTRILTAVVYNGYLYTIGGDNGSGSTATVNYAPINTNGTIGSWTATTSLTVGNYAATSVVYNGYIYEIGGSGLGSTVEYAQINTNGTLGIWTTTTSLPAATMWSGSVISNGYLYEIGGQVSASSVANVYYAPLNSNGTVGTWSSSVSLPVATSSATTVTYNGYIYEIGGGTTTVNYAAINNGGPGTVGAWTATTALPAATYAATSAVYNGYLYEIGGIVTGGTYVTTVSYAPINANGTVGTWTATTSLPITTGYATSVAYNGYLYEIGGNNGTANVSSVYYAPINTNGTIGAWTATTSLPAATYNATSVVYNSYLYEIGGYTTTYVATVSYAPINTNGTIGSWTATTALPVATGAATSVAYNGYVYEIGGASPTSLNTVYYAALNANGTIGAWTATTSLPIAPTQATSVAYNGYLYEFGGVNINATYYAPINTNGTIGNWTLTTSPTVNGYATAAVYNGYVYTAGGCTGSCAVSAVNYAPLNVMSRVGHYSQMFNFGSAGITPFSITYSGSLPNANGLSSIQYKTAGSNAVLGASQYSTVLNGTATDCIAVGTIQYVSVNITLDDSGSAAFPDVNTTPANVTDFTVTYNTYHPSPNLRLRGGKYFSNNVLQPLDTCAFVPVPNSPTIGTATDNGSGRPYNNGLATVSFTPSPTGYAATSYRVTASSGGYSGTGTSSPITVSGLQSGVSYTFTVTASNAIGASNPSLASNAITTTTVPQAPTIGTATAGNAFATVSYTANATGGLSNTYTAISSPGSITGTGSSPITVSGLTNGTAYTFTVTATNTNGTSVASSASNSVTPAWPVVTGGSLASDATYYYRTFTASGTLGVSGGSINFDVLVIGGGGAGGGGNCGGGGGAGGVLYTSGQGYSSNQTVTVGGGGGGNSSLGGLVATGGGNGGGNGNGFSGGSGGGGAGYPATQSGGTGIGGQGNNGGTGFYTNLYAAGGGGGAGGVGGDGSSGPGNGGNGGNGTNAYAAWATATGTGVGGYYAGGGGGCGYNTIGTGGLGGGGNSGKASSPSATAASGYGSGGGGAYNTGGASQGTQGIVIVRYTRAQVGG